ncbi:MAG TPA: hypothetical protein VK760_00550, partial [Candidatus Acidoferrales bacterium]|nr:hypothetical protein [Candidatus Acidoferrales bacterium]
EFTGFSNTPTALAAATITYANNFAMNDAGDIFVTDTFDSLSEGAVYILTPPYTGTPAKLSGNVNQPGPIVVAPDGSLVIANEANGGTSLSMLYPFTGASASNQTGDVSDPHQMILDSEGNLWISNLSGGSGGAGGVVEFAPGYIGGNIVGGSLGVALPNSATPISLALDDAKNLYVNGNDGNLYIFAPPYTGTPTTVTANDGSHALHVYVK